MKLTYNEYKELRTRLTREQAREHIIEDMIMAECVAEAKALLEALA